MINRFMGWLFGSSLIVYVATKMTGRDKLEMVERAEYVVKVLEKYGIKAISPVLKEGIKAEPGKLINYNKEQLKQFWKDDKDIIRYISHVVLFDHAEMSSFGMTREYCLNRGVLWKPTVIVLEQGVPVSVAEWEDDAVMYSVHAAAAFMSQTWGSRIQRWKWRLKMMNRSLPKWIKDQIWAWR